jgi:predicted metal-dependent peptidase
MTQIAHYNAPEPTSEGRAFSSYAAGSLKRTDLSDETTDAMSGLAYAHPFYASYLYDRITLVCLWPGDPAAAQITTAATDGRTTYVNAAFFAGLTNKQRMGVLAHEISHDMLGHPSRMRTWSDWKVVPSEDGSKEMPYHQMLANIAMDAEINPTLLQSGLELPKDRVEFPWVKPGEWSVEGIYERLLSQQPPPESKPGEGEGESGEGEESDLPGELTQGHGNFDQHIIPGQAPSDADEEDRRRALKAAVANGKRAGNVPAHLERLVERLVRPVVDWREVLRDMMVKRIGQDMLDWSRMNKRRYLMIGVADPARRSEHCGHIVFIFDTSGSVSPYIQQFLGEVAGVAEELSPKAIHVLWTDTRVAHVDTLEDARGSDVAALTMHGGGGTDLRKGFDWIDENLIQSGEEIAAVVVLTDSETDWPREDPGYPVIVATTGPNLSHRDWMEVVEIPENEARRAA